jgi:post-segregation antitoxin (ccd killing protein)
VYSVWIPRINIYLPDELAGAAKKWGFNLSALAQEAIRGQLGIYTAGSWLGTLRFSSTRQVSHDVVMAALDAVREAAPEPHG